MNRRKKSITNCHSSEVQNYVPPRWYGSLFLDRTHDWPQNATHITSNCVITVISVATNAKPFAHICVCVSICVRVCVVLMVTQFWLNTPIFFFLPRQRKCFMCFQRNSKEKSRDLEARNYDSYQPQYNRIYIIPNETGESVMWPISGMRWATAFWKPK